MTTYYKSQADATDYAAWRGTISRTCDELKSLLLRKNDNYGDSASKRPALVPAITPGEAILIRMSDKVSRIAALNSGRIDEVGETLADTVQDLAGYCVLWLAYRERESKAQANTIPAPDYNLSMKED